MDKPQLHIPRLNWLDYLLVGGASCLAAFSAGYGIADPQIAIFFVVIIAAGTLFSYILHRLIPPSKAPVDGALYATFAFGLWFFVQPLNDLLPGEGFAAPQLRIAGALCWMLAFGSFFMWRDATVLFQAVPGIAVFGLVGTWDTFRTAPFLFFVFLLCFATLFARAHARSMMVWASQSGFHSTSLTLHERGGFWAALRRGPWRWMAGPEWALGSALAIIAFSLVGAPIFQYSLQSIAGQVKIPTPTPAMRMAQQGGDPNTLNFTTGTMTSVGNGPRSILQKKPIFAVRFFRPPYLRYHTFTTYSSRGWQIYPDDRGQSNPEFNFHARAEKRFKLEPFMLRYIEGHFDSIPIPGDFERLTGQITYFGRADGTVANLENLFGPSFNVPISGRVRVPTVLPTLRFPDPAAVPPEYTNVDGSSIISARVRRLAETTVKGIQGDDKKAEAIRALIAKRAIYDTTAPATPAGRDPVDYFLFDSKRGYCDLFASAMVVMCRAVNIPARLVNGYVPFTDPLPSQDFYTIYQTDYHMWAEVYFKDVGWMVYDPTDGADAAPGHGRGTSNQETSWYDNRGVQIVGVVLGLGAFVALLYYSLVAFRRTLRVGRAKRTSMDDLERAYVEFVRTVESRTGKPMRPSDTPDEYLAAVKSYLNGSYNAVAAATESFVRHYYSTMEPTPEAVEDLRNAVKEAKAALKNIKHNKS